MRSEARKGCCSASKPFRTLPIPASAVVAVSMVTSSGTKSQPPSRASWWASQRLQPPHWSILHHGWCGWLISWESSMTTNSGVPIMKSTVLPRGSMTGELKKLTEDRVYRFKSLLMVCQTICFIHEIDGITSLVPKCL